MEAKTAKSQLPKTYIPHESSLHRRASMSFTNLKALLSDDYETVSEIDMKSIPRGTFSYRWLELLGKCTGEKFCIPVMIARGVRPGPVFGLCAAIHGDEIQGAPVIHAIFNDVQSHLRVLSGSLIGIPIVNVPSFVRCQRTFPDQARDVDLNRKFPGKPRGTTADQYVYQFFHKLVPKMDYLIDLHSACFGNLNSMYIRADLSDLVLREMAYVINADIILHSKGASSETGTGLTLREAASRAGVKCLCIELENPSRFSAQVIERARMGILALLVKLDMIPFDPEFAQEHQAAIQSHHQVDPVVCRRSYWVFTQTGGLLNVLSHVKQRIEARQVIAVATDLFGVVTAQVPCPESGIVIGQSQNPVQNQGGRVIHLGIIAGDDDFPRTSALQFDRRDFLHSVNSETTSPVTTHIHACL